jgi:menaquinone-9 beta-reductase
MITPTITATGAASRRWDVLVIGAGPSGGMAALSCARAGASVLLIDRCSFPRAKVCGCCLNPAALALLTAVEIPLTDAVPLQAMHLSANGHEARLALNGAVLSREALDAELIRAAIEKGAHFMPNVVATRSLLGADCRKVSCTTTTTTGRMQITASIVIVADGLDGAVARHEAALHAEVSESSRIGAGVVIATDAGFASGVLYMASCPHGYVGLVRLEDGRANLACALDASFVRAAGGVGLAAAEIMLQAKWPEISGIEQAAWHGTARLTRRHQSLAAPRLFLAGDAAGYVEPFTGEGIAWALASGRALAPLAAAIAQKWDDAAIQFWNQTHAALIRERQRDCRVISALLRHRRLTGAVVGLLMHFPGLAAPLVRRLARPYRSIAISGVANGGA